MTTRHYNQASKCQIIVKCIIMTSGICGSRHYYLRHLTTAPIILVRVQINVIYIESDEIALIYDCVEIIS